MTEGTFPHDYDNLDEYLLVKDLVTICIDHILSFRKYFPLSVPAEWYLKGGSTKDPIFAKCMQRPILGLLPNIDLLMQMTDELATSVKYSELPSTFLFL